MARRILPFAIALPFMIGWLRLQGQYLGLYGTEFGLALFATSNIVLFVSLVWWSARIVNRLDAQRYGAAAALAESNRLNEQIIRSVGEGIIVLDHELRYVVWNPFMERLTGITAQEIIGKHPLEVFPHFRATGIYARIERALAGEQVITIDVPFVAPNTGQQHWLDDEHAPLHAVDGATIGVIVTVRDITGRHHAAAALHEANEGLERKVVERTAELQATQAQLQLLADHDTLTQIYNRRAFEAQSKSHLNEAKRYGGHGALLLLDIDYFKPINDRLGHAAGDAALVAFTGALRGTIRETDVLARLGGDEFAVLAPFTLAGQAEALAAKLLQQLAAHPLSHNGELIRLSASIGIAPYDKHTDSLAVLLAEADQALYQAKQAGRGCYRPLTGRHEASGSTDRARMQNTG
jgi:diguanylate cyclase (GGDEF)-like protein/PAS domain S-box-containing protein